MTLLKGNDYKEINVALLSLEADIKNKITNFDTSVIDKQLAEINSRIDKINAGGNNSSAVINDIRYEIEDINSKLKGNSAKIDNIEQKLSDIFSAENKVTDFNTTTDSGIYYWVTDAANKPTDYGVLLVNKYYNGSDITTGLWVNQIAYGTNNKIYFRQNINSTGWTEWKAVAYDGEIIAKKVANALTINGKTYDGSEAVDAGVQTVENGGTGQTTQDGINKAFVGGLPEGTSDVTDGTMFVSSYATDNGFADTDAFNVPFKRKFSTVWNYIKGKISSVLGLTKDNYGGTAATILDYVKGTPIKVRYGGPGINSAEWYPAFNADGSALEPIYRNNIHAGKADTDANGNNIVNTYATKTELEKTTTKSASLSTVTTGTTKYIKLGTFHWYDSFSFKCRIVGNSLEDNVDINILAGNSNDSSVCGYYSTNSGLTQSIIVKRGEAWNSNFEIYLKIYQLTTAEVYVTIDKGIQDRINISESTTAPSGTLEEIAFNNRNGMFSSNIDAIYIKANRNITLDGDGGASLSTYGSEPLTIGFPSGTGDGQSLGIDRNSMQVRINGAASDMYLNFYGGMVIVNYQNQSNGGLKVKNKMVIPIGAPSSLEDGCIWIER